MTTPLQSWASRQLGEENGSEDVVEEVERQRIPKQAVLYLHVIPDDTGYQTGYQCKDCPMFVSDAFRCVIHGPDDDIEPHGTCGYWVRGQPVTSTSSLGNVTKLQSGYIENDVGFACKRCLAFVPEYTEAGELSDMGSCKVVDSDAMGDDPGSIHPNACCAAWTAHEMRAAMEDSEFPPVAQSL